MVEPPAPRPSRWSQPSQQRRLSQENQLRPSKDPLRRISQPAQLVWPSPHPRCEGRLTASDGEEAQNGRGTECCGRGVVMGPYGRATSSDSCLLACYWLKETLEPPPPRTARSQVLGPRRGASRLSLMRSP